MSSKSLIPTIIPPPNPLTNSGRGVVGLSRYVDAGASVDDFCEFSYGDVKDKQYHCAHFVGHALGIRLGKRCDEVVDGKNKHKNDTKKDLKGHQGFSIRVDELYNKLAKRGPWPTTPPNPCLIIVTVGKNYNTKTNIVGGMSTKHIGIYTNGDVVHYGNTEDKVVRDQLQAFISKFSKGSYAGSVFLYGEIP